MSELPKGWVETTLGEVVSTNDDSINRNFGYSELEYLDTGSIIENKIKRFQKYTLTEAPSRAKRLVKDGDIVYSTVRPNQRHYGFIRNPKKNTVVSTGFAVIRSQKNSYSKFIFYWLTQNSVTDYLHQLAEQSTSAYPSIKPIDVENLSITIPKSTVEQKAIAAVLSAFDDKIELLRAQNETLERIAQTIFKEWFVHFNFPDQNGKPYRDNGGEMVDSELGKIPKGWRVGKLKEFGRIICGKTPPKSKAEYFGGDIPFIKIPDMHNQVFITTTSDTLTEQGKKSQELKTIPANSILVSCIATVGLVGISIKESQTNQQINTIVPQYEYYREYLYLDMLRKNKYLNDIGSGGTATLNVNTGIFSKVEMIIPEKELLIEFSKFAKPIFDKMYNNTAQIQTLSKTRDTLLPKLMSGEIRVKGFEQ